MSSRRGTDCGKKKCCALFHDGREIGRLEEPARKDATQYGDPQNRSVTSANKNRRI